jgi:hypothetical protein
VQINRLSGNPAELWNMPNIQGTPAVNLAAPNNQPMASQPPGVIPVPQGRL